MGDNRSEHIASVISFSDFASKRNGLRSKLAATSMVTIVDGLAVVTLGDSWGSFAGGTITRTPKQCRDEAGQLLDWAYRADQQAAELAGGTPMMVRLRKMRVFDTVERAAQKIGLPASTMCIPVPDGGTPNVSLVQLWATLHGSLSFSDIADLWNVKAWKVSKLVKGAR